MQNAGLDEAQAGIKIARKVKMKVAQLYSTLCNPMDYTVYGILQTRILEWVAIVHLRLLIFLPAILIPACASSNPAFCMIYSAYKLNKQSDNIQP